MRTVVVISIPMLVALVCGCAERKEGAAGDAYEKVDPAELHIAFVRASYPVTDPVLRIMGGLVCCASFGDRSGEDESHESEANAL